ncbi:hypothetical protein [Aurantimonas sp. VKM B-3413]|uniref:hypothetical protein n=1 Tax=Aurantimonas sp. VKM B-3413 TaxID=2779401 RepID=UPI001E58A6EC|nr:hypothetical protein [Aurantimonas sp. VKM B-3413]MCB8835939.1 hypothetical protein [Aurantimonas sp. VKM B-3413]
MARKPTVAKAAAASAVLDAGPKAYRVKPGIGWVNGRKLKAGQTEVTLSAAEARYDLQLERIVESEKPDPKSWSQPAADGEGGEGEGEAAPRPH